MRSFKQIGSIALSVLFTAAAAQGAGAAEGALPKDRSGRPLNLDFEDGTLRDWTATGNAFQKQPVMGDTVYQRRSDMKSQHRGNYWIGGYEAAGDNPKGTLTSVPWLRSACRTS